MGGVRGGVLALHAVKRSVYPNLNLLYPESALCWQCISRRPDKACVDANTASEVNIPDWVRTHVGRRGSLQRLQVHKRRPFGGDRGFDSMELEECELQM